MTDRPTYTADIRDCDVCHKRGATHYAYGRGTPTLVCYCDNCAAKHKTAVRIR